MLYIVGLGPGAANMVTPRALEVLKGCERVMLRTGRIACAQWLREQAAFESLDDIYEAAEDFDGLCAAIAERVCASALKADTAYAVSDVAEATVGAVLRRVLKLGKEAPRVEIVPGVPPCGAATAGTWEAAGMAGVGAACRDAPASVAALCAVCADGVEAAASTARAAHGAARLKHNASGSSHCRKRPLFFSGFLRKIRAIVSPLRHAPKRM